MPRSAVLLSCFFGVLAIASAGSQQRLRSSAFAVPGTNVSYDYVVVGGGTAGLTIASRLAEWASVAVIEAGGIYEFDNGNLSVVPSGVMGMSFLGTAENTPKQPLMDWGLISAPQSGAGNQRIRYAQGKTLGGSSAINTGGYHRGTAGAYQRWADVVGDQSYTFSNLLPYFKKSCHLTPPNLEKRNTPNTTVIFDPTAKVFDNSLGGVLQVSWANWVDPTTTWLALGLKAIGLPLSIVGFSSGILSGYSAWIPTTISPRHATRSSSESSYLKQSIERTQIMIYLHTQALRILFDSDRPGRANAVAVSTQGLEYTISANKEVIISTGVFHSPQLLMVSGIGPRVTLEAHGIPVIANLPGVGQNLQDELSFLVLNEVNTPSGGAIIANPENTASILKEYLEDAKGPMSSVGVLMSFEKIPPELRQNFTEKTKSALDSLPADWPEVEYLAAAVSGPNFTSIASISPILTAPLSRGNVTITSSSMADPPVIDMGWLTDPADAEVAVAAIKRCRQAWASDALQPIKVGSEILPGEAVSTDEEIVDYLRQTAAPIWHASATCAMGKLGDVHAVVDSKARVFGVERLRVVDASSFPFALPGHPQASVYAFAEKIADDIKNGR
ncbi:Dehydrogenase patE [Lachnellula suecica]|uniref:Dehydrogenase patE n=1 Tax=Lachnellula suecica TaxID=602035 RepID=A0A8T9CCE3_9HELO|nr:Dehydrogenase patE [Lachnellula suecica]